MFYFGITALDRFKTRLKDYPQYCNHVSGVPHFKDFPPHLIEWVELGAQSIVPPTKPTVRFCSISVLAVLKSNIRRTKLMTIVTPVCMFSQKGRALGA